MVGALHIMQVFGAASSGAIHATVFHGDLIPLNAFINSYRYSPILTLYTLGYTGTQFQTTQEYIHSRFGIVIHEPDNGLWVRRSTGFLCIDIVLSAATSLPAILRHQEFIPGSESALTDTNSEVMASRQMSLRQYHTLCDLFLQSRCHAGRCGQLGNLDVLTSVPDVKNESFDTGTYVCVATMIGESIRFNSVGLSNTIFDLTFRSKAGSDIWLSQANDIRRRLEVIGKLEDHTEPDVFLFIVDHSHSSPFLVESITFVLGIDDHPTESPPPGYLFLRPSKNFQTGPISFRWPECPAYWSLDPLGTERLTAEEATRLGFPAMQMSTSIEGKFWKAGVYAGLRQFHAAKGFDPDGQDVARHLGYPLHELCSENDAPSVHVEERESLNAVELHVSRWFKVLINVQLTLIFFLLLCQVYEAVTKF